MTTWYQTRHFNFVILAVEVRERTPFFVDVQTCHGSSFHRERINGLYADYWQTKAEAVDHLIKRCWRDIDAANKTIQDRTERIGELHKELL
jgi:hypothetical protein